MAPQVPGRMPSVDFLRGVTVAFMIVANNPGDTQNVYSELIHAKWHGWTAVDLIFPTFLFLVGVSVAVSVRRAPSERRPGPTSRGLWGRAFRRAAVLFGLGLLVNGFPFFDLDSIRIPGVLQRIAVVYLAVLWLHVRFGGPALAAAIVAVLAGYWALWAFVPVPGLGYPTMDFDYNLEGWLDQMLMRGHIWEYDTTWDPEGVLSTLPSIAIGLMGVLAGRWLRTWQGTAGPQGTSGQESARGISPNTACAWMFLTGVCAHLAGIAWNDWFPINKVITTSSFALFVGGIDIMLLALAHRLLDGAQRLPDGAHQLAGKGLPATGLGPFLALGRNALFLYVVSQLLTKVLYVVKTPFEHGKSLHFWLFDNAFSWMGDRYFASLGWALALLAVLTVVAVVMDRRGMTVRL